MMTTSTVIGISTGKRLLSSSFNSSDLSEKFLVIHEQRIARNTSTVTKSIIVAKKSSPFGSNFPSNRHAHAMNAIKEHVSTCSPPSTEEVWFQEVGMDDLDVENSLEAIILLQKAMLEKQWSLSFDETTMPVVPKESESATVITRSGIPARQRRVTNRKKYMNRNVTKDLDMSKRIQTSSDSPELQGKLRGYVRGRVSEELLTHADVVYLSSKIKTGLYLEEQRMRLKKKLGLDPSDKQLATALRMSRTELQAKMMECSLARAKLTMSNVRLVMSIAQKYENSGADMSDLIQGGLIGLLRGIEKFDSSKGCRISTYVYWWIRQGVTRALVENSKALRLPPHLHERLSSIRNAKMRLEGKGITPSIDNIAESLNMSKRKIRNATEAVNKVISLDRQAFPSLNGLPGETLHSYVADNKLENNPWHGFEELCVKDEVDKLLCATLGKREREIIRLYHGLGQDSHTWEDISTQFGLSRERVRQVGLIALEKLKLAARRRNLEAMLVKH